MEQIKPFGLHKLWRLESQNRILLSDLKGFLHFSQEAITQYDLISVGTSSHVFDTGGFTAAICLMESHICVHTWPELNSLTLDIYMCNYNNNNEGKVQALGLEYIEYFEGNVIKQSELYR